MAGTMSLKNIGMKPLFIVTFLVLGAVALLTSSYLLLLDSRIASAAADTTAAVEGIEAAQRLQRDLFAHKRHHLLAGLTRNPERVKMAEAAEISLRRDVAELESFDSSASSPANKGQIQSRIEAYLSLHESLRSERRRVLDVYERVSAEFDRAYESSEALLEFNAANANRRQDSIERLGSFASVAGSMIVVTSLAMIALLAFLLRNWLFRPLAALRNAIVELKQTRSFDVRAPVAGARDVREISHCFNEMTADLATQREAQFRLIATVAHDIKNPLGAIAMSAEVLAEDLRDNNVDSDETLGILRRQISTLERVVGDLLETASVEAGSLRVSTREIDLNDVVGQVVSLHQQTTSQHKIQFEPAYKDAVCVSDPERITQILNNLLSNAIKYSPKGGVIQIIVKGTAEFLNIEVTDAGIGIPREDLEAIFEPFRRSSETKDRFAGVGLGLASCKRIAKALGGDIKVRSQSGIGSTFTILIPRATDFNSRKQIDSGIESATERPLAPL